MQDAEITELWAGFKKQCCQVRFSFDFLGFYRFFIWFVFWFLIEKGETVQRNNFACKFPPVSDFFRSISTQLFKSTVLNQPFNLLYCPQLHSS